MTGRPRPTDRSFDEFKPLYGSSLVTGWAKIHGRPIGILANAQGVLFCEEAQKATQFIQLANQVDTPLLFLHNTTGYMVGKEYEQGGIIKHGAMMINAVSNSTVPHLSVIMGASYGAGNYGMNGRAYDPRFLFTWPSAKSAVMGPAQLAGVLSIVARAAAEAKGKEYDEEADDGMREFVEASVEEQSLPFFLSGMLYDDGVIDPRDTRTVLGICLSVIDNAPFAGTERFGVFRPCINRLLVANRGEIASPGVPHLPPARHRDRRGALRRGRGAAVRRARPTVAVALPGNAPAETYLRARPRDRGRARSTGADAVHPGYGFLSENADFARAVLDAGLTWVGPTPESIEEMGSKVEAKKLMGAAGVPVLGSLSVETATEADLPLLVKASAGGGGRGMRDRALARRPAGRGREGICRGGVGVRRRHRLRRAVRRERPPRRGAGRRPRGRRAGARRAGLLDPAPAPEGGRGVAGPAPAGRDPRPRCTRPPARRPARSTTAAPAPSSSSTTRTPTASSSWR